MVNLSEIQIKNLDHLGIVAGIIDEIGIVEIINDKLGIDSRSNISKGQVVKAMLLNGLGMVSKPLYLFSQFFADKAIEKLLGPTIKSEYLNDDKLGRVMDELHKYGLTKLFTEIGLVTINKFKIVSKFTHLDATSFHLHGEYKSEEVKQENEEIIKERPIFITKGYSRDHRPDLNQCILDLVVSSDGDIPLFIRIADGNEADKAVFAKVFRSFKNQLKLDSIMVADSALYSQDNLEIMKDFKWITRVPITISKAKELIQIREIEPEKYEDLEKLPQPEKDLIKCLQSKGYKWQEKIVNYGDIDQRWLIVESEKRKKSDREKFEKQLQQSQQKAEKILKKFLSAKFENIAQARAKLTEINQSLKFFEIQEVTEIITVGKSSKTQQKITGKVVAKPAEIEQKKQEAGRFILATNILDKKEIKSPEILGNYKNQQGCERGFGFLKDPLFFADSFFVKKPQRVETILFIMSLCLLVYNLGQRELRNNLLIASTGVKNQVGKLTNRPTLRWIFQCFQGIYLVFLNGVQRIVNLTEERNFILDFLPTSCQRYYQ